MPLGAEVERLLAELRQIAAGVALVRRGQRPHPRARHGERRADGDASSARASCAPQGLRGRLGRCAHHAARRRARGASAQGRACCRRPATSHPMRALEAQLDALAPGRDHAGLHRQRRGRQHRAARARRLGHLGGLSRGEAARAAPGDLDRRAGHVQRQPALDPDRAPAARAALRRGAGDRHQRREGAAPALHPAGAPVPHSAARLRHAGARTSRARCSAPKAPTAARR